MYDFPKSLVIYLKIFCPAMIGGSGTLVYTTAHYAVLHRPTRLRYDLLIIMVSFIYFKQKSIRSWSTISLETADSTIHISIRTYSKSVGFIFLLLSLL